MTILGEFFLAANSFDEQYKRAIQGQLDTRAVLIGLTLALAVGFAVVFWVFLRSRKKSNDQDRERLSQIMRSQRSGRRDSDQGDDSEKSSNAATGDGRQRRRKHRRRRDHRQRNPSLSETGGLPPPRPDDQLPKY